MKIFREAHSAAASDGIVNENLADFCQIYWQAKKLLWLSDHDVENIHEWDLLIVDRHIC
jgi:pantothenate kinase-related protein Tda10